MSSAHGLTLVAETLGWDPGIGGVLGAGPLDSIDSDATPVPGLEAKIKIIIGWAKWICLICGVAGFLLCAGKMAIGSTGRSQYAADAASELPKVLVGLSLGLVAVPILTKLL